MLSLKVAIVLSSVLLTKLFAILDLVLFFFLSCLVGPFPVSPDCPSNFLEIFSSSSSNWASNSLIF
jgi:hypothetical protein